MIRLLQAPWVWSFRLVSVWRLPDGFHKLFGKVHGGRFRPRCRHELHQGDKVRRIHRVDDQHAGANRRMLAEFRRRNSRTGAADHRPRGKTGPECLQHPGFWLHLLEHRFLNVNCILDGRLKVLRPRRFRKAASGESISPCSASPASRSLIISIARSAAPGIESNKRTGWPALANTIAQPAPTRPVPTTATGRFSPINSASIALVIISPVNSRPEAGKA